MAISNEKLALLYNETENKQNKQKIFIELKNNLKDKTKKIIHFFIKNFSDQHEKYDDYQNYMQTADMILLSTLNMFMGTNDKFILEKWYVERLKNEIYDINRDKIKKENNEVCMDFQLEHMENITSYDNYDNSDEMVDNSFLYDILKVYLNKIEYKPYNTKTEGYFKNILMENLGFNEEKIPKSYAELARIENCTRQNIKYICEKYKKKLVKLLKKDNRIEELRQYL